MPHIPNTNLSLTEAEIQAVVNYAHDRKLGLIIDDEEFEMPEKFKNIINTGRLRNKEGKLPVPPIEYSYFIESNNA